MASSYEGGGTKLGEEDAISYGERRNEEPSSGMECPWE